jgi:hypothetical protein
MSLARSYLKCGDAASAEAAPNYFVIGQDIEGRWVVRDRRGLKGGIFATYNSALNFAKGEAFAARCKIIVSQTATALDLDL